MRAKELRQQTHRLLPDFERQLQPLGALHRWLK